MCVFTSKKQPKLAKCPLVLQRTDIRPEDVVAVGALKFLLYDSVL